MSFLLSRLFPSVIHQVRTPSFAVRCKRREGASAPPSERRQEGEVKIGEKRAHSGKTGTDDGHGRLDLRPHIACDHGVCKDVRILIKALTSTYRSDPLL